MTAEIVSVGTELLLGHVVDTHASFMARILAECGVTCLRRTTVGDNLARIVAVLQEALTREDVVITIGGLGPTLDDLTRDAIAQALDEPLEKVPEVEERLRRFFASRNIPWLDSIGRQAEKPRCAQLVRNPNGTAPGLHCQKGGKTVVALPGPKGEFEPMAQGPVKEILAHLEGRRVIHSRTLRVIGLGESMVEERIKDLMDATSPTVAPYAHLGEVHLRITAGAATEEEADKLIEPAEREIRRRLGKAVFGTDSTTLEAAIIQLLVSRGETIALAESMTGGELGGRLTSVPGASKAVVGGAIVYTADAKREMLGVDSQVLEEFGAVSAQTASQMAEGARRVLGSTWALSITGNAGPDVDSDNKQVGLVYIGLAGPSGTQVEESKFRGIREDIRRRTTQQALVMLREAVLGSPEGH